MTITATAIPRPLRAPAPDTAAGRVYDMLVAAALEGEPCPTVSMLMRQSGCRSEARVGDAMRRLAERGCIRMEYPPGGSSMARGAAAVRRCVITAADGSALVATDWYRPSRPDYTRRPVARADVDFALQIEPAENEAAPAIHLPPTPADPHEALGRALAGRRYGNTPGRIDPQALARRRVALAATAPVPPAADPAGRLGMAGGSTPARGVNLVLPEPQAAIPAGAGGMA